MNARANTNRFLIALGLSFVLWAFVSFSQNPEDRAIFENVPVVLENVPNDLVPVDRDGMPDNVLTPVHIAVDADRATLAGLRKDDLIAKLDLTDLTAGDHIVRVNITALRSGLSLRIADISPREIPIRLDTNITRTVPLTVVVRGNVPFGFELGKSEARLQSDPQRQPLSTAAIIGPQNRISRVESVRAIANVEQVRSSYAAPLQLQAVDRNGVAVDGVRVNPPSVEVRVPVNPVVGLRRVPIAAVINGSPAPGFVVRSLSVEPPILTLTGSSGPLDAIEQIETDPVTIAGVNSVLTREVGLRFPPGTSPLVGEPTRAVITVRIEPIARAFEVRLPFQVQLANLAPGLSGSVNPLVIQVTLSGTASNLGQLDRASLIASVDMRGRGAGTYMLIPSVVLPPGIVTNGSVPSVTVVLQPILPTITAVPPTSQASPTHAATAFPTQIPSATAQPATPTIATAVTSSGGSSGNRATRTPTPSLTPILSATASQSPTITLSHTLTATPIPTTTPLLGPQ